MRVRDVVTPGLRARCGPAAAAVDDARRRPGLGGLGNPLVRELRETQYQFRGPFVVDSTAAGAAFGITPAPIDESLAEAVRGVTRAAR